MGLPTIFWDFDGTLAWREGLWRRCLADAVREVDPTHPIDESEIGKHLSSGFPWHSPEVAHTEVRTAAEWWDRLQPTLEGALTNSGVEASTARSAAALVRTTYTAPSAWKVYDDVRPSLNVLRERGWRHVILSNHAPELPQLVVALGLDDLVSGVLTSADIGWEKPNLFAFRYALAAADHPSACFMVGDNPVADIQGAQAALIPAVLVRTSDDSGLGPALETIPAAADYESMKANAAASVASGDRSEVFRAKA
jgi:putative hydrolase of the HAD superfamily